MLKQHRKLSMFVRRTTKNNEKARIRPSKTYQSFVVAASSHRELSFIEKNVRNYITKEVQNISEQDDTKEFGKYNLVFGSFVGVNHHDQSTLLGCDLMKNEDIQSFKWLFECWLRCMGGKAPKGIFIDQCASMQKAIEMCMPTTIQRWCIWHIMKKIPSKLNGYKRHKEIEQEMSHIIWNLFTKDALDRNWNDFVTKFGVGENKWRSELYEDRHLWIPVYLDHYFWVGMRSTQRSESMHTFFNKFITWNSSLIQFVKKYDNCLASREQREKEFDATDIHTVIPCATKSSRFLTPHSTSFFVTYDTVSREVKCQCLLFKSRGVLCRHLLSVLSFERVDKVAPKYILECWSKNIKWRYTHIKSSQDEPLLKPRSKRFDDLATLSDVNGLQSPPRVRTRGRPKNRVGSNLKKDLKRLKEKEKASSKRVEPFRWWINDSVKLQPLQCTGYELSRRGLQDF
ncbi:hypothetical protein Ahy_A05g025326 [Arachis hypogaea]|uniref:SWIM-type domain-containing protein n=1 Tax=Arachis hypogaea TaxID=3818 RepID=A0A445D862_ARAHY|nr:hypothetical protein Ahy_A05g025326 [Arachis hypogaea]